jgi:hypothetical protein
MHSTRPGHAAPYLVEDRGRTRPMTRHSWSAGAHRRPRRRRPPRQPWGGGGLIVVVLALPTAWLAFLLGTWLPVRPSQIYPVREPILGTHLPYVSRPAQPRLPPGVRRVEPVAPTGSLAQPAPPDLSPLPVSSRSSPMMAGPMRAPVQPKAHKPKAPKMKPPVPTPAPTPGPSCTLVAKDVAPARGGNPGRGHGKKSSNRGGVGGPGRDRRRGGGWADGAWAGGSGGDRVGPGRAGLDRRTGPGGKGQGSRNDAGGDGSGSRGGRVWDGSGSREGIREGQARRGSSHRGGPGEAG